MKLKIIIFLFFLVSLANSELSWNLTATTNSKNPKEVISKVIGKASKGKLHAIIGPSGSGKTTLLNILAGIVPKGSLKLKGKLNKPSTSANNVFVQQDDLLFTQLTVGETLETSARLKNGNTNVVHSILTKLGIKKVENTIVGDAKSRGISGGEKKRLSIGNELIGIDGDEAIIFADEPTVSLMRVFICQIIFVIVGIRFISSTKSNGNFIIIS